LTRGLYAGNYTLVLISSLGLAVAQPFMLNAISPVAAKWFPIQERATASGLVLVATFFGIGIGMVVSPILMLAYNIQTMLLIFGIASAIISALFLIFTREAPPTPPCPPGQETRALVLDGLKSMLKMKDIWILIFLFLIGMAVFNGVSTWIEGIVRPRGFTVTQAGDLGGALLLGGILGAAIIPIFSDKQHKRKVFLLLGMALAIPGLIGLTFATQYWVLVVSMLVLGFFLMGMAPIGYQYGAETTYPAPEGTTNGLLNMAGQASVIFIFIMDAMKSPDGSYTSSLIMLTIAMVVCSVLILLMNESTFLSSKVNEIQPSPLVPLPEGEGER
jgi:MFS family permease